MEAPWKPFLPPKYRHGSPLEAPHATWKPYESPFYHPNIDMETLWKPFLHASCVRGIFDVLWLRGGVWSIADRDPDPCSGRLLSLTSDCYPLQPTGQHICLAADISRSSKSRVNQSLAEQLAAVRLDLRPTFLFYIELFQRFIESSRSVQLLNISCQPSSQAKRFWKTNNSGNREC